ncbi:MAG: PAS domain-containing protein [Alphaproteobacteria bacterium]|nr:PAS domain-containing protein [Alphaproteobacteria bacterium]
MADFKLLSATPVPVEYIANTQFALLYERWNQYRGARRMPAEFDLSSGEFERVMGRIHVVAVEGPKRFRFRRYGTRTTNPDRADMTGKTTLDFQSAEYAKIVTEQYEEARQTGAPSLYAIEALANDRPYRYARLTLPVSKNGKDVSTLIIASLRIEVSTQFDRWGPLET